MTTNGSLVIDSGAPGTDTIIISAASADMAIAILGDELAWVINTLGEIHREREADARRAQSAAALAQWNADALAGMMTG